MVRWASILNNVEKLLLAKSSLFLHLIQVRDLEKTLSLEREAHRNRRSNENSNDTIV